MWILDSIFYRFYCFSKVITFNIYAENTAIFIIVVTLFLNVYKVLNISNERYIDGSGSMTVMFFILTYVPLQLYYGRKKKSNAIIQVFANEGKIKKLVGSILVIAYLILTLVLVLS